VCRNLRGNLRTSHIPIIFLTQRDERSDKIHGLELGADDYITKPFDLEELKLRVKNAMVRSRYESLTNATTGLPSGRLIEDQLRRLIRRDNWGIIYVGIKGFGEFKDEYGFVAGEEVLRFAAMIMGRSVDNLGTSNDFIGHIGGDDFWIVAEKDSIERLTEDLRQRFDAEIGTHYDWKARQEGNLMTLSIGVVTVDDGPFYDIREITEAASSARREAS
jgi:diguanylate cyclase (GGDEF)-like protein